MFLQWSFEWSAFRKRKLESWSTADRDFKNCRSRLQKSDFKNCRSVHYGIFNASYASLKLTNEKLDGKDFLLASGYGKTIGLARLFFKVEDYYSSYFDDTVVTPYFFKRNIYEGGYTKNLEVKFNPELQNATVNNIKNQTIETINTEKNVQDLISSLYYLRKNFSILAHQDSLFSQNSLAFLHHRAE